MTLKKVNTYPFDSVQFSCGKCLRQGRYTKANLIERFGGDMPCPDLRRHIAHDCPKMMKEAGTDPCAISYPDLLKAHLDRRAG